jgi:hypothetical protein
MRLGELSSEYANSSGFFQYSGSTDFVFFWANVSIPASRKIPRNRAERIFLIFINNVLKY